MISVYNSFLRISISIVMISFIALISQSQLLFVQVGGDQIFTETIICKKLNYSLSGVSCSKLG